MNLDQKLEYYRRFGWCPLPYKHLPKKIRSIMQQTSWRLQMKMCYKNCQLLSIYAHDLGIEGVEYVEGWYRSMIWMHHAWLEVDGKLVDPTLEKKDDGRYEERVRIPADQIRIILFERGTHGPLEETGKPPDICGNF